MQQQTATLTCLSTVVCLSLQHLHVWLLWNINTHRGEVLYLREILRDFYVPQIKATCIYEDNLACIDMSEHPVRRKYSRHIDIRRYFVRELVLQGVSSTRRSSHSPYASDCRRFDKELA